MTNILILAKLYSMAINMASKYAKVTNDDSELTEFVEMFDRLFNQLDLKD